MSLEGKTALVTGASSGIGRATAMALADEGVHVGLAARRTATLETVARSIRADGGEAFVISTDMRARGDVRAMVETVRESRDRLDIMVNSAGVGYWTQEGIVDGDLDTWTEEIEVNLLGLMYGTHLAASVMVDQGEGDIVNIGSGSGRIAFPQWPSYVASKFGVRGFTESAMRDLRDSGVRVTLIEPGEVATPMQPEEELESSQMLDPEDVADAIVYAVSQPDHVCLNAIQIIPSGGG